MKKILKVSLILAGVLAAMNVSAGEIDFSLNVKKEQGKTVTFVLNDINKIDLSIYDANEKLIHTEKVTSNGTINRTYDLNALPEGTYFLDAESEMKIARYEISVVGKTATLTSKAISEVYKPVFLNKNGLVSISVLNLDKSPVSIKIYTEDGTEVYATTVLQEQNVAKFFDIKNFPNDKYAFIMTYDNKVFEKIAAAK
ncbi:hypothetical protein H4V97_002154 [Flavobacterium sp. CG_23.5]|uniref:hypothetical protein n=1 Tax=unclassified Flavobacterium TaxID=196869 RepID=UPI0018CB89CB|nr:MULTISPECIES: hypothetical protein [unclassified Flavobacterium]MBG6110822.1 hypothetical protein [Flavobacterium sp. CG_9.10]MBP2283836.1 hypothetical protein [Flavobacterium sp. CG_23.5]